jgi:hypothetical protein
LIDTRHFVPGYLHSVPFSKQKDAKAEPEDEKFSPGFFNFFEAS